MPLPPTPQRGFLILQPNGNSVTAGYVLSFGSGPGTEQLGSLMKLPSLLPGYPGQLSVLSSMC